MMSKIKNGIYLVINPEMDPPKLVSQLTKIKEAKLSAIQVWDNFSRLSNIQIQDIFESVFDIFKGKNIPILINNRWEYLNEYPFAGVHFDVFPNQLEHIVREIGRPFLKGLTLNNDLSMIKKVEENGFHYLSFCSMFTSSTSNSCEIVRFDTVKKCKEITNIPFFIAGGITPQNIHLVDKLDYNGIAVVSGIMESENPAEQLAKYSAHIKL